MSVPSSIAEVWNLLLARMALWAGRRERARAALKRILRRNPGSFRARFALGKLYLVENAVFKAKREFDLAWQIDARRFEHCYTRLRTIHQEAPDLFSYGEQREEVPALRAVEASNARSYGDFQDEEEWQRFRSKPPISLEEIAEIDWERLEQEIFPD